MTLIFLAVDSGVPERFGELCHDLYGGIGEPGTLPDGAGFAAGGGVRGGPRRESDFVERRRGARHRLLRQDVLGRLCSEAFLEHADAGNNPLEGSAIPLLETMRDGKCLTVRASLRKKSGQSVGVHVRTVPLRADDGRMQGAA